MKDECRDVTAFLDEYVEQRLASDARRVFEEHIAACPDCARFLASYRATRALASDALGTARPAGSEPPAEPVPDRLIDAILAARRRQT